MIFKWIAVVTSKKGLDELKQINIRPDICWSADTEISVMDLPGMVSYKGPAKAVKDIICVDESFITVHGDDIDLPWRKVPVYTEPEKELNWHDFVAKCIAGLVNMEVCDDADSE